MSLDLSQSTSSCSLSDTSLPVLMALMPSIEPVRAQQPERHRKPHRSAVRRML